MRLDTVILWRVGFYMEYGNHSEMRYRFFRVQADAVSFSKLPGMSVPELMRMPTDKAEELILMQDAKDVYALQIAAFLNRSGDSGFYSYLLSVYRP